MGIAPLLHAMRNELYRICFSQELDSDIRNRLQLFVSTTLQFFVLALSFTSVKVV
jgi:hypothetical protein